MKRKTPWLRTVAFACAAAIVAAGTPAHAITFQTLHAFKRDTEGVNPAGRLVLNHGVLYGTTLGGGNADAGTVFELKRNGRLKTLYQFQWGSDGDEPAGLIQDRIGNLYGVTVDGGTVYKIGPDGTYSTLYTFLGGSDGYNPIGPLLRDRKANLYGTTSEGGGGCNGNGCGTVYELAPDGTKTMLHLFAGGSDGEEPAGGLVADKAGDLFGVTRLGGAGCEGSVCGTVYELTPSGQESVVYAFTGGADGQNPVGELVIDTQGNLFGVASGGNSSCGGHGLYCGIVFEIGADGTKSTLHAFNGTDGWSPAAGLATDASGNLYGTTAAGGDADCGTQGCGTVFEITSDGSYTLLHSFAGRADGDAPDAPLVIDKYGDIFGTTVQGGSRQCFGYGCGTIFELTP
ncbi:MAG TPA: choice-of-anchor tandem repeat GloVer-containing protein [Rhizomicrobium sp.]